jgi:hypothetical protein
MMDMVDSSWFFNTKQIVQKALILQSFSRPYGTLPVPRFFPALKCWATFKCPYGTNSTANSNGKRKQQRKNAVRPVGTAENSPVL